VLPAISSEGEPIKMAAVFTKWVSSTVNDWLTICCSINNYITVHLLLNMWLQLYKIVWNWPKSILFTILRIADFCLTCRATYKLKISRIKLYGSQERTRNFLFWLLIQWRLLSSLWTFVRILSYLRRWWHPQMFVTNCKHRLRTCSKTNSEWVS